VYVTLRAATESEHRTEQYLGRDHLVVKVVAIKSNIIIRPLGSKSDELVPPDELRRSVVSWNGRHVLPDHPSEGSANNPELLSDHSFGVLFNTKIVDGDLHTEAWLDVERAEELGGDPQNVVTRVRNNDPIEVSVGAYIVPVEVTGKEHDVEWTDIASDHLAMLPEGDIGACSNEAGCGVIKDNRSGSLNNREYMVSKVLKAKTNENSIKSRLSTAKDTFYKLFRSLVDDSGESMSDVQNQLTEQLRKIEDEFGWICAVYPESSTVIYQTWESYPSKNDLFYRRSYELRGDGVYLSKNRDTVSMNVTYETTEDGDIGNSTFVNLSKDKEVELEKGSIDSDGEQNSECGCRKNVNGDACDGVEGEETVSQEVKNLVEGLINGVSPYGESDRESLMTLCQSDVGLNTLKKLSVAMEEGSEGGTSTGIITDSASTSNDTPTAEEWLSKAPESVQKMLSSYQKVVDAHLKKEEEEREETIAYLSKNQEQFNEESLKVMGSDELRKLRGLVESVKPTPTFDFSLTNNGSAGGGRDSKDTLPNPYSRALKALKERSSASN
jgi:hypothetical protein